MRTDYQESSFDVCARRLLSPFEVAESAIEECLPKLGGAATRRAKPMVVELAKHSVNCARLEQVASATKDRWLVPLDIELEQVDALDSKLSGEIVKRANRGILERREIGVREHCGRVVAVITAIDGKAPSSIAEAAVKERDLRHSISSSKIAETFESSAARLDCDNSAFGSDDTRGQRREVADVRARIYDGHPWTKQPRHNLCFAALEAPEIDHALNMLCHIEPHPAAEDAGVMFSGLGCERLHEPMFPWKADRPDEIENTVSPFHRHNQISLPGRAPALDRGAAFAARGRRDL